MTYRICEAVANGCTVSDIQRIRVSHGFEPLPAGASEWSELIDMGTRFPDRPNAGIRCDARGTLLT